MRLTGSSTVFSHTLSTPITSFSLDKSHPGACWQVGEPSSYTRSCSAAPCGTGSAVMVLGQRSAPLPRSPLRCPSSTLSTKHCPLRSQRPEHSPCLAAGEISWHCHILLFGHISLWESSRLHRGHRRGTGRSARLCVCTPSETWLAGHGRCRDFQSFPVLSHALSMGVQETKKLSSLLCYFSSPVTLATVSKCNAHDILLLP